MSIVRIVREKPITRKEWHAYIEGDPELRTDGEDSVHWSGVATGEFALLVWREGRIESTNPTPELIAKMKSIGKVLGADVRGQRGESYHVKPKARAPLRLDPLQWQFVTWGLLGAVIVAAVILFMIVKHLIG